MNLLNEPLFQAIFNTPIPRIIINTDAPDFTIIASNDAQKRLSHTPFSINIWETLGFNSSEENGMKLMSAIMKAIASNQTVLTPVFNNYTENKSKVAYSWQIEVKPIAGINNTKANCLLLTIHTIVNNASNYPAVSTGFLQQQSRGEAMALLNEALAASNDELACSRSEMLNHVAKPGISQQTYVVDESESRFRKLVQQAPVAMVVLSGPDMVIEIANNKMLQFWNLTATAIGKPLFKVHPHLNKHATFKILRRVFHSGRALNGYEIKGTVWRNGKTAEGYCNAIFQPIKNNHGRVTGLMAVVTDVTEQVNARHELDKAYEQMRLAKEAAQLGMFDLNLVDGTLEWDERCRTLFGISHNRRITYEKDFWQNLHPEDKASVSLAIDAAFNKSLSDGDYDVEYRTLGAEDKKLRWVRAKGKVLFDEQHTPVRFIGSVLDITEQKQDEQRKSDFIGIVSHELKTPLTSLKAYIQLLNKKVEHLIDPATAGLIVKAENQVNKMTTMIKSFLDVSRFESGKIHIEEEAFIINTLIEEIVADVTAVTTNYSIIFLPAQPIWVYADREKISHVIHNILNNAIKYSPVGSTIKVRCEPADGMAVISIQDQGIGIAREDLDKLFDRYYRVQNSSVKMVSGFGIGLYLSAEIVKRHQGKIWVNSEEGNGAVFFFSLPEKAI